MVEDRRRRAGDRPPQGRAPNGRNHLKGRDGDRSNAALAAGFNLHLLLRWFERFLRAPLQMRCPVVGRAQYA
jgi:IS5 family transposase